MVRNFRCMVNALITVKSVVLDLDGVVWVATAGLLRLLGFLLWCVPLSNLATHCRHSCPAPFTHSVDALFLHTKCLIGLPQSCDFCALRLPVADPIPAVANGINGRSLRRCADPADKRHLILSSSFRFRSDGCMFARECFSSILSLIHISEPTRPY